MIKDIIVNLSVGERPSPASDYAVSVAAAFDAHLAGIAFLYDPIIPVSGAGYIPAEVIEAQERDNAAAAKTAIRSLRTRQARAPASQPSRSRSARASPASAINSAASRGASICRSSDKPSPRPARWKR